jgi:hypothetical protein
MCWLASDGAGAGAMELTKDQKLLLLSAEPNPAVVDLHAPAPGWLVDECERLGLVKRIAGTTAWTLTTAGIEARRDLLGE